MAATGEPIVTDGEQRASSFATYPITEYVDRLFGIDGSTDLCDIIISNSTLGGTGLAKNLAVDGQVCT